MQQLSLEALERIVGDMRNEPEWRLSASRECAYYDNKQLDSQIIMDMHDRGIMPVIRNLIAPTIDVVLGMEAKNRRNFKVITEDAQMQEVGDALSVKLSEAERASRADRATSDAYASQIKAGFGCVEVARESDPWLGPYRVKAIHRNEIYWDWRSREPDWSDARWVCRHRWLDEDELLVRFPSKRKLIENLQYLDSPAWMQVFDDHEVGDLLQAVEAAHTTSLQDREWYHGERRRYKLIELWYRVWQRMMFLELPNHQFLEFDRENERHVAAVVTGRAELVERVIAVPRLSWWLGPHRLADMESPYPHNSFPYVPFWGYREDESGIPYGMIRRMMSPQDEINARLSKMIWLLSAKTLMGDSDAFDMPLRDVANEAGRPDAVIFLNPKRRNPGDKPELKTDYQLSQQQFQALKDAEGAVQDSAGVYQAMLGKDVAGVESGVAINSLVEQGATTLAEINDNYRYARTLVGELLLSLIKEDIGTNPMDVHIEELGSRRTIVLNQPYFDSEKQVEYRRNDLVSTRMKVSLSEIPDTPAYRMEQQKQLTEFTKSLPDDLKQLIAHIVVQGSDLPHKNEIARLIAQATGAAAPETLTPEQRQEYEAQKQVQAEDAERERRRIDVEIEERMRKAEQIAANTEKTLAQIREVLAKTEKLKSETVIAEEQHESGLDTQALDMADRLNGEPKSTSADEKRKKP